MGINDSIDSIKKKNNYFDGIPVSKMQFFLFMIIIIAFFFEQMDNQNFSYIAPALISSWNLDRSVIGQISSLFFIGMTLGGLCGGLISDFLGRRKAFLWAMLVAPLASIVNGMTSDLTVFMISRAITGFGIFCLMVIAATYMAEITPAESRGKMYNLCAGIGFLAMPVVGILSRLIIPTAPEAWRIIFYIGGMGLIPFFLALKYLKESPRWLVTRGRIAEAEKIVKDLTGVAVDLSEVSQNIEPKIKFIEVLLGMFSKKYIRRSVLLLVANAFMGIAFFVTTVWVPTLLNQKGFDIATTLTISTIIILGTPLGTGLSGFFTDMGGRKIPLGIFLLISATFAFLFGYCTGTSVVVAIVIGFLLTLFMNCTTYTMNSYIQESYPTKMRSTSYGIVSAFSRINVSGAQLVVPAIITAYGFSGVFTVVGLSFALTGILILAFGIRTAGKSLEEIS